MRGRGGYTRWLSRLSQMPFEFLHVPALGGFCLTPKKKITPYLRYSADQREKQSLAVKRQQRQMEHKQKKL
jgi:hypothetical protein